MSALLTKFKNLSKLKKILLALLLFILAAALIAWQKVLYLSADPKDEKDCTPTSPFGSENPDQPSSMVLPDSGINLPWIQKGGIINDASCLDETRVSGIVQVTTEDDIKNALKYAKENNLKVSVAGVKHSMGGQAFYKNALILDMNKFNNIAVNESSMSAKVQSGATWHQIQGKLHPKYAVKAMQSTDIFSVGGSISVNAHGMDHQIGALGKTIKSMRVMLPNGEIVTTSKTENPELFNLVVGGYGLFGIILDADLDITTNDIYNYTHEIIDYKEFPELFENKYKNSEYGLFYGHLSTAPSTFLKEMILYPYQKADYFEGVVRPLSEVSSVKLRRFVINMSKSGNLAKEIKWFAETRLEPLISSCMENRNQAMKDSEGCLVSRNEPMHDSVPYLRNNMKNDTDILHEYFIPREKFVEYIDKLRETLKKHDANLLNASVRAVHKEENFLNYAPNEAFSVVLYVNQSTDEIGNKKMDLLTRDLIDVSSDVGGKFFLPYQLYYSKDQLTYAYPQINDFFNEKKKYDPDGLLTNTWYETYSK